MSTPKIVLKHRKAQPLLSRHPWVFAGSIDRIEGHPADGDAVLLHSSTDQFVAHGLYNSNSKIAVRLYSWSLDKPLEEEFWRSSIKRALRFRQHLGLIGADRATRLIFSEGDELSGLVVDKFGDWLTMQFTSLAMANRRELLANLLTEELHPKGIYLRTEKGIGKLEGLALQDCLLRGEPARDVVIREHGIGFTVDLEEGQKTGFYVDQRDNHLRVAQLMVGRDVLDAFCYSGGFGLHCIRHGAKSVIGVDVSAGALVLARQNAEANGLANIAFEKSDVFQYLHRAVEESRTFSGIILDPPKFARDQKTIPEAMQGYRRLLRYALRLATVDSILVMCCCSGLITAAMIEELIADAAADSRRFVQIIERRGQAPDHPVSSSCPETSYLKCLICRVL